MPSRSFQLPILTKTSLPADLPENQKQQLTLARRNLNLQVLELFCAIVCLISIVELGLFVSAVESTYHTYSLHLRCSTLTIGMTGCLWLMIRAGTLTQVGVNVATMALITTMQTVVCLLLSFSHDEHDLMLVAVHLMSMGVLFLSTYWLLGSLAIGSTVLISVYMANDHMSAKFHFMMGVFVSSAMALIIHLVLKKVLTQTIRTQLDLSLQKDQLNQVNATLEQMHTRFHSISETVPCAIFECDQQGLVTFYSPQFQHLSRTAAVDRTQAINWIDLIHPEQKELVREMWKKSFDTETAMGGVYRFNCKRDNSRIVRVALNPEVTKAGVCKYVGMIDEITAQQHAHDKLRHTAEQLRESREKEKQNASRLEKLVTELKYERDRAERLMKAKSEFLANMSHEIRTPMSAILGYTEVLEDPDVSSTVARNAVSTVKRNGEHLLELINDILDLSKIEAGKLEVEQIECDLKTLLSDCHDLSKIKSETKQLDLILDIDPAVPSHILSDPTRLKQILLNLLSNAIKFTSDGHVKLHAQYSTIDAANRLVIDVTDTGIGMSQEQMAKLFNPFEQADQSTSRKYGGTGLGLTISQHLAKALGGEITITSQQGFGSNFRLTLDGVQNVEQSPQTADLENFKSTKPASPIKVTTNESEKKPLEGWNILLAEDGADNQRLISYLLKKQGAEVTLAENGQLALDACRQHSFDVILMDMQMPVMDGYTATTHIRQLPISTPPIIALTAHAMEGDRERCLQAGCDDYLSKPVRKNQLVQAILQLVELAPASV